ncbi:MAG: sugar transferase [Bacteroidales bacterium]|nr:sugar transferase [Bacteroidales bacterium]
MNKKVLIFKYIFFDLVAALIVWILFMIFRWVVNDGILFSNITIFFPNYNYYTNLVLFLLLCLAINYLSGYYLNPIKESKFFEFFTTLLTTAIISVIIFFVLLLDDIVVDYTYYYYSLLVLYAMLFGFTWLFRIIQTLIIRRNFKRKKWTINTLIVGTGKNAQRIASEISKTSLFNTVVGYVKVESFEKDVPLELILGNIFEVGKVIENNNVSEVVVALDDPGGHRIFDVINRLFQYNVDIWFTPRLYEILTGKVRIEKYGINPLVSVTQPTMSDWELCVKRAMDIVISVLSLILLSPFMIYFAIAIKMGSKGPVLYKQERIGRFGKSFNMLKFRSMYYDSEKGIPQLSGPDDDRITKVGRTMRKYRLDEIPQFFNVIKGDMSLVGPRPERKYYIDQIVQKAPYYCLIYRIRPGLTSWGPIKIGYADTIEKMIERLNYDIVYTEDMNLGTDLKIIFFTLEILFKGKGM